MNDWQGIFPQGPLPYQLPGGGDYVNQVSHRLGLLAGLADPRNWQRAMTSFPDPRTEAGRAFGKGLMGGQEGAQGIALDWGVNPMGLAGVPNMLGIFKGMNANLSPAETEMLAKAFELEQQGMGREAIRQATNPPGGSGGWFRAPWDKKWRMEVDDGRMGIYVPENLEEAGMLPEFVSHPQAMEAYPQFKNLALQFGDDTGGMYKSGIVTTSPFENARSVTLHEMQHPIQEWEGMARGGSPELMTGIDPAPLLARAERLDKLSESGLPDVAVNAKAKNDLQTLLKLKNDPLYEDYLELVRENNGKPLTASQVKARADSLWRQGENASPYNQYRRLAGEGEARLVQARRDLTPAQRLAIDPIEQMDTMLKSEGILGGIDDLIVRYGDGPAMSTERRYWRGENPGDTRRIKTGDDWWDSLLFVANDRKYAEPYGKTITELSISPDAKVLKEGTADFVKVAGRQRKSESLLDFGSRTTKAARDAGYDAVEFKQQGNMGTAIINRDIVLPSKQQGLLADTPAIPDDLGNVASTISQKHGLQRLELMPRNDGSIELSAIEVPKDKRKAGIGTRAMQDVVAYADSIGKRIVLTPGLKDELHGTTSRGRLVNFYKRFGFVENKGRNKDFAISAGMYRNPLEKQPGLLGNIPDELPFGYPERIEAFRKAREHAALPVEQGGLGLGPANTAAERVAASGANVDVFHGRNDDFSEFDMSKLGTSTGAEDAAEGIFTVTNPSIANEFVWGRGGKYEGANVMPLKTRSDNPTTALMSLHGTSTADAANALKMAKRYGYDQVNFPTDVLGKTGTTGVIFNPANIRSRFAAFDPFRRNESDLLASWLLPAAGMGLLGLGYLGQGEQTY